jgi:cytochrome c biogenesis protein
MEALNPTITHKPCLPSSCFLKSPLLNSTFKPTFSPHNSQLHNFFRKTPLSLSLTCRLKTPQENKNNKTNNISKKIILSEGAPPPLAEKGGDAAGEDEAPPKLGSGRGVMGSMKRLPRKVLSVLSYLPLAIGEMFAIAGLMALGMLSFGFLLNSKCLQLL